MTEPKSTHTVFEGKQFTVVVEEWERRREVVRHPGSVAIVAVHDGDVVLVEVFREPVRKQLIELPAGLMEAGEAPLESAKRELAEEVGLRGGTWTLLGSYLTSPGFVDERMHLFLADGLEQGEQDLDDGEDVRIVRWPVRELVQRLDDVEDMKTLAGLLLYLRRS